MAAKHVLRYLQGTVDFGLRYVRVEEWCYRGTQILIGKGMLYTENPCLCCFSLGSMMILWYSGKQQPVALSSRDAEYMAVSMASYEAMWFHKKLARLFELEMGPTVIPYDN